MTPLARMVALPVRAYRLVLSPWIGHACRFQPTCSAYALEAVADQAIHRGTGARGLRSIMEDVLKPVMFELPSRTDVGTVVISGEAVRGEAEPVLIPAEVERRRRARLRAASPARIHSAARASLVPPSGSAPSGSAATKNSVS